MKKSSRLLLLLRKMIVFAFIFIALQGCNFGNSKEVVLPPTRLSTADLQFGRQQVTQMMLDRPNMFKGMGDKDVVYEFVARQFAGEESGQRTYWSNELPDCGNCLSFYSPPHEGEASSIRIQKKYKSGAEEGQEMPFEQLWECAVYELYNAYTSDTLKKSFELALAGNISKQQWVDGNMRHEFETMQKTRQFYQNVWYPEARRKGLEASDQHWYQNLPNSYEEWLNQSGSDFNGLYDYYSKDYDETIAPYVKSN